MRTGFLARFGHAPAHPPGGGHGDACGLCRTAQKPSAPSDPKARPDPNARPQSAPDARAPSRASSKFATLMDEAHRDQVAQVAGHLGRMLNTREGFGFFREGYGLSCIAVSGDAPHTVDQLSEAIQACVERYETRAAEPRLTFLGSDESLCIHLRLDCRIGGRPATLIILFQTMFGNVSVQSLEPTQ